MSLLFSVGQIRALEEKIFRKENLDRMVGSATPEEAFRVFIELGYAQYFDEKITAASFESVLEQGLVETKQKFLVETENDPVFCFLWTPYDINNLKRAAKMKFLEGKTSLDSFSFDLGFSSLGNLSREDIASLIFEKKVPPTVEAFFSPDFLQQILKMEEVWEQSHQFFDLELLLDHAGLAFLGFITQQRKLKFVEKFYRLLVDLFHLRIVARSLFIRKQPLEQRFFFLGKTFLVEDLVRLSSPAEFAQFLQFTRYSLLLWDEDSLHAETDPEKFIAALEYKMDRMISQFLHDQQEGEIDSLQVLFSYLYRRLENAKMIRLIMNAKFYGLSPEEIYPLLHRFSL